MSNDLLNVLQSQLDDDNLMERLSSQIGADNKDQTKAAASGIMTTLMGAMAKKSQGQEGQSFLSNILDKDGDGSILDDVMDMVQSGGQATPRNAGNSLLDGGSLISSLLGGKENSAVDMISNMSGLESGKTNSLMKLIAPMLIGTLTKQRSQNGLDVSNIAGLLTDGFEEQKRNDAGATGLVEKFLDQDGDGSITDDIANIGMKFLGNLFKK